jgi:mannose-6-phosphate isomerase
MEQDRETLLGPAGCGRDIFPWLIKFLDASDWLSVQVHPDAHAVKRLCPGEGSKTEVWFIHSASPGSRIYAGLLPGVTERHVREALAHGTVADCLYSFEPRPGDCVFLPAGTVHAVGGGVLLAEVQETSDATFRIFDWNRRDPHGKGRTLHVEEAMASIDWTKGPVSPVRAQGSDRQPLVQSPHFVLEHFQSSEPFRCGGQGRLQALIVLYGRAQWGLPHGDDALTPGGVWLLPAAMSERWCHPEGELKALVVTLP